MRFLKTIEAVDTHTEGNPTRIILGGVDVPPGETLRDRKRGFEQHHDDIRRLLNLEPRGGGLMCSVLLMEPMVDAADYSILIMEQEGYVPMCGHCVIGTAMTVVATGMVEVREPATDVTLHTLAGLIRARVRVEGGVVQDVTITNVESFLLMEGVAVDVDGIGEVVIDVGYGGDFYPMVDADGIGLELIASNEPAIVAMAQSVRASVRHNLDVVHPEDHEICDCYQVLFHSSRTRVGGDVRCTVVAPPGAMDRSPCGTGTSALTARAVQRGDIGVGEELRVEGPLDTVFTGRVLSREARDGVVYHTPTVTGRAFITGFHKIVLTEGDPFPAGFQVGVTDERPDSR